MRWIPFAVGAATLAVAVQHWPSTRPNTFEIPARTDALSAQEAAECIRAVIREARQQHEAHSFPPASRVWTAEERAASTAVLRRIWDFKRKAVRGCITDSQAEAFGRIDVFILMKMANGCDVSATPAAAADVIEGAAAGSMTADDQPVGPFFVGQDIARRDYDRRDGSASPHVCAGYMDLFGPRGRQFAGLLQTNATASGVGRGGEP